jgi:type II secretory ATPase GspE/PulE/Tfp pilus assembly ATPase PilB-like protein
LPSAEVAKAAMDLVTSDVHVFTSFHLSRLWYLPLRLEEFFGKDFKTIFLQLNTVYNQKMFTKLCPHCKRKLAVSELDEERREFLEGRHVDFYFENAGCSICSDPKNREIQPFAEHLYFTEEIVDTLLDIDHTFEMVRYLKKLMISSGETIDDKVCRAISEGVLGIEALDLIL